jgi:hypothetical protein
MTTGSPTARQVDPRLEETTRTSISTAPGTSGTGASDQRRPAVPGPVGHMSPSFFGPATISNGDDHGPGSGLGSLAIGYAFPVGRASRTTLRIAGIHGDPPAPPPRSDDHHRESNGRSDDSPGTGPTARVKSRPRRRSDHHVVLAVRRLGDLDVVHHTPRSTGPRNCQMTNAKSITLEP